MSHPRRRMPTRPAAYAACAALLAVFALTACERGHSARWYMAHGEEMQAKVKECQADPQRVATDKDCTNAIEGFVTWARASGHAAAPTPAAPAADPPPAPAPDKPVTQ